MSRKIEEEEKRNGAPWRGHGCGVGQADLAVRFA